MNEIIKNYLDSSEPFRRFFGSEGLVSLSESAISPKLLDFTIEDTTGYGRPLDADDLKAIGVVLISLGEKLKERSKSE